MGNVYDIQQGNEPQRIVDSLDLNFDGINDIIFMSEGSMTNTVYTTWVYDKAIGKYHFFFNQFLDNGSDIENDYGWYYTNMRIDKKNKVLAFEYFHGGHTIFEYYTICKIKGNKLLVINNIEHSWSPMKEPPVFKKLPAVYKLPALIHKDK